MNTPDPEKVNPATSRRRALRAGQGFTLIELLFVVAILAVLLTLGAPSLANLLRDQRIKTATFDVYAALIFARSEAIKRNADIDILPVSSDWAAGWQVSAGGTTLKNQDALAGVRIAQQSGVAIGNLTYRNDGRLTAGVPTIVVWSPDNTSLNGRCVAVDLSGRPNIKIDSNNNPADGC